MRILLVNDTTLNIGGAEKVVYDMKKLLESKGHIVKIFGKKDYESKISLITRFFDMWYYYKTKKLINNFKPDIIHAHNVTRNISPSPLMAAKKSGIKVIMTVHDFGLYCPKTWGIFKNGKPCKLGFNFLCPFYNCYTYKKGLKYIPLNFLKFIRVGIHRVLIKKYVDFYLFPSKALKEVMSKSLHLKNKEISYLPNFIDSNNKYSKINYDAINQKQFLFVGRLSKEKGIDIAIRAVNYLIKKENLRDIIIKIVGDGSEMENLKNIVNSFNIKKNVIFVGKVNNKKIDKYYKESIAILMPSIWLENNPLVALEAMKNRKPIIASNIGGFPDLIENNKNGFLFTMGNYKEMAKYMKLLYNNKKLSIRMGEYGFKKLQKDFNKKDYYKKLERVYNKVINQ